MVTAAPKEAEFSVEAIRADSLPLPDGDGRVHQTSVSFTEFAPGQTLTNVNDILSICLDIEHSWMHDMEVNITCPSGKKVILQDQREILNEVHLGEPYHDDEDADPPGFGKGYNYCFTPQATNGTWTQYSVDNFYQ